MTVPPPTPPTPPPSTVPPSSTAAVASKMIVPDPTGLAALMKAAWSTPASAAIAPAIPYASISVRVTLTPASRAAVALPPVA